MQSDETADMAGKVKNMDSISEHLMERIKKRLVTPRDCWDLYAYRRYSAR